MWSRANYSPILSLTIDGKEVPDILSRVTSFRVKFAAQKAGEATFELRNDDFVLLDDDRFFPNTAWRFRFGFADDLSPAYPMIVRNFEPKFQDKQTLTVTLFDGTTAMAQNSSSRNWGAIPSSLVAQQLAEKYGLTPEIEPSPDKPKKAVIQPGDVNDIQFLRDLAADIDFEVFVNSKTLIYRRKPYDEDVAGVLVYAADPTERAYVRSFTPKVKSLGAVSSTGAAGAKKDDAADKKGGGASTQKVQLDGDSGAATVPTNQAKTGTSKPVVGNAGGLAQAAKSQMLDRVNEANSEHPLTPSLLRGKNYDWQGVGRQLGGKWYLHAVTHSISGKDSKTECEWKRNQAKKGASSNSTKKDGGKGPQSPVTLVGEDGKATVR